MFLLGTQSHTAATDADDNTTSIAVNVASSGYSLSNSSNSSSSGSSGGGSAADFASGAPVWMSAEQWQTACALSVSVPGFER